jgi:hypothetical protein
MGRRYKKGVADYNEGLGDLHSQPFRVSQDSWDSIFKNPENKTHDEQATKPYKVVIYGGGTIKTENLLCSEQ